MPEVILTDENFEKEVIDSKKLVLVDFWAPGCPHCMVMEPVIAQIAEEFEGKVRVGKLNAAKNQKTATRFAIREVPTFIIFKNGEVIERIAGARSKQDLVQKLNSLLSNLF